MAEVPSGSISEFGNNANQYRVLVFYDPTADTNITVDESPQKLGAILTQQQQDGLSKPTALTDIESRYSQTEPSYTAK